MEQIPSNIGDQVEKLLTDELGDMGSHVLKKQCEKLGIDINNIHQEHIPSLAVEISKAVSMFGTTKAKTFNEKLRKLGRTDELVRTQANPHRRLDMVNDLGIAAMHSGEWIEALNKFNEAEVIAKGLQFWAVVSKIERDKVNVLLRIGRHDEAERNAQASRTGPSW